jgi:hypothetical protein
MYYRLPEEEPLVSKQVEDVKKLKYKFRNCAFRRLIFYNYITLCGVNNIKFNLTDFEKRYYVEEVVSK